MQVSGYRVQGFGRPVIKGFFNSGIEGIRFRFTRSNLGRGCGREAGAVNERSLAEAAGGGGAHGAGDGGGEHRGGSSVRTEVFFASLRWYYSHPNLGEQPLLLSWQILLAYKMGKKKPREL